jgi:deazaflavin-dependent oxidoreductase (nitroreductase family)
VPLPAALGRFNRRVTNPILWPIVRWLPGYGTIVHVGRRSGRTYRTPVLAFRRSDRLVIALTYGSRTEWARNVIAAGACVFESRTATTTLVEPRLIHDEARAAAPALVRFPLRLLGAADFLELRVRHRVET